MRRVRSSSRVAELGQDRGVRGDTLEAEIVGNVVGKKTSLGGDILVESRLNLNRVAENVVNAGVSGNVEDVRGQRVIGKVSADRGVVDKRGDSKFAKQVRVTDS